MRLIRLKRISQTGDGTFGVMLDGFHPFAVTVEPEWQDNLKNKSCIPFGCYLCKRIISPKYGSTFEVTGVEGRSHILIHWGNIEDNTKGCIIVAEKFGELDGKTAVLQSRNLPNEGFNEFLKRTRGLKEFELLVSE